MLPPIFAGFRPAIPASPSNSRVTNRNEDLARGHADIAVRMVRPTQSGLVARRIGVTRIRLYAHRDYLEHFGDPRRSPISEHHCFIGFDRDNPIVSVRRPVREIPSRARISAFAATATVAQLAALRAGVGIGGCQDAIARRTPELVPVLSALFQLALEVWLVMHRHSEHPRGACDSLFDWLALGLTDYVKGRPAGGN